MTYQLQAGTSFDTKFDGDNVNGSNIEFKVGIYEGGILSDWYDFNTTGASVELKRGTTVLVKDVDYTINENAVVLKRNNTSTVSGEAITVSGGIVVAKKLEVGNYTLTLKNADTTKFSYTRTFRVNDTEPAFGFRLDTQNYSGANYAQAVKDALILRYNNEDKDDNLFEITKVTIQDGSDADKDGDVVAGNAAASGQIYINKIEGYYMVKEQDGVKYYIAFSLNVGRTISK